MIKVLVIRILKTTTKKKNQTHNMNLLIRSIGTDTEENHKNIENRMSIEIS